MNAQPQLFDAGLRSKPSPQELFLDFHRKNPRVYEALVRYARKAKEKGHASYGIGALWEIIRWETNPDFVSLDDSEYRMNNNFRSRYARLIMKQEPDLKDFFRLRELRRK